ncbi:hypothetical protein KIH74_28615 [Kineosporia sp. J2-2]|uniref:Secreted protein n=1 Tax=Kineosporia corallincola TaxID=2835133 RepID=A0ABS5TPB5_9ACTN|nr:hypothetical protein [Kineosporia corallincola]MBT0772940.1 hypothetical protein [Kineosporia corallincola]
MSISFSRRTVLVPVAVALAAAAGVVAFVLPGSDSTTKAAPTQAISAELTAYEGEQPEGFSIEQVPAGWDVLAADAGKLVLAAQDASDRDPNEFEGKILVTVANEAELSTTRPNAHEVKVGDVTATGFDFSGGDSTGLLLPSGDRTLIFQLPGGLEWDEATVADFAAGVHSVGTPDIAQG